MASTRATTGNSKPRVFPSVSTEPVRKTAAPKKRSTTTAKPTTKKTTAGRVTKPAAKGKPSVKDKVEGAAKKVAGTVERKPAKKAAGSKQAKGTDGKTARARKV